MASLGATGGGSGPYLRGIRMAGRLYELVPAISWAILLQHHSALSSDCECGSSGCVRECGCCYGYAVRRCILDWSDGDPGFQWSVASMGGSARARIFSGRGDGSVALCAAGDLRLHLLFEIGFRIGWRRCYGLTDWRIVSVMVSAVPRAGETRRLMRGALGGGCGRDGRGCARR